MQAVRELACANIRADVRVANHARVRVYAYTRGCCNPLPKGQIRRVKPGTHGTSGKVSKK